jgi:aspartate racemase
MSSPLELSNRMKTIGIIGGSTNVATAEYYSILNAAVKRRLGGFHTAKIIMNSMDLATSVHFVHGGLWDEGSEFLRGMAQSLERAGADFIICVSNTWNMHSTKWMAGIKIPLLHITEPLIAAIESRKVALLGTKATMSSPYIPEVLACHGIETIVPTEAEMDDIDSIIFQELSYNNFLESSKAAYLKIVDRLCTEGAKGVILGCTEIPLLIKQSDRPDVPFYDTLELHAEAAAALAVEGIKSIG